MKAYSFLPWQRAMPSANTSPLDLNCDKADWTLAALHTPGHDMVSRGLEGGGIPAPPLLPPARVGSGRELVSTGSERLVALKQQLRRAPSTVCMLSVLGSESSEANNEALLVHESDPSLSHTEAEDGGGRGKRAVEGPGVEGDSTATKPQQRRSLKRRLMHACLSACACMFVCVHWCSVIPAPSVADRPLGGMGGMSERSACFAVLKHRSLSARSSSSLLLPLPPDDSNPQHAQRAQPAAALQQSEWVRLCLPNPCMQAFDTHACRYRADRQLIKEF
jgi:hypothetical protein